MSYFVRCPGTFSNYLGYLRAMCLANGFEAPPTHHPAIGRSMVAIAKRGLSTARPKHFIFRTLVRSFVVHISLHCFVIFRTFVHNMVLAVDRKWEEKKFAMLWVTAYVFLLRLPSEASTHSPYILISFMFAFIRPFLCALAQLRRRQHPPSRL